jgi:TonB family protein
MKSGGEMDEHTGERMPSIIGRYQVQESIGYGAMGAVYKAFDPLIKRTLAIKTIRLDIPRQSPQYKSFIERFYHEARISGTLSHPNIVTLFDIGEEGGLPYLAMEFVEGETIASIVERGLRFKPEKVIGLVSQVASAIDYAHTKGVIHRDIKPSNLILYDTDRVKVTDFGIAKLVDAEMTQSGTLLGTPSYMSPEQAMGDKLDGRSDIFSLGVCAFEMLCGEQPFPGNNVTSILYKLVHVDPIEPANLEMNGLVPEKWHEVFGRVLAKKPDDRYQTATEFVQDLEYCLGAWFGAMGDDSVAAPPRANPAPTGDEVTAALPAVTDPARKTNPPVARQTHPPGSRGTNPPGSPLPPARKTNPPGPPAVPAVPRGTMAPMRRTATPPTPPAPPSNPGTGSSRAPVPRAPEPEGEEPTVFLKGPAPSGRRPAAPAEPLPVEEEPATVVMRSQGRAAAGARPARAPEPESDEPSTVVMEAPPPRTDRPGSSTGQRAGAARATPPPIGRYPAGPPEETATAPSPVLPGPRRSVLTLTLGGIGLVLLLVLLTTVLILIVGPVKPSPAPPTPAPPSASPTRPTSPVPTSGVVHVETTPAGAVVFLDGKRSGKTPLDVHEVSLASHEVRLELEGYAPVTESVMLTPEVPLTNMVKTLSRTAPVTGTVDVSSTPSGAMVKVDGTLVGVTPMRGHKVNVGSHRVEVSAEGYDPFTGTVRVKEGATATVNASLQAKARPTPKPTVVASTPPPPPTPDPTIYDENNPALTAKPVKTFGKSAEYPKEAVQLKRGQRASVTAAFVVLESGDVTDVQIVESAGTTVDDAVVAAYRTWKFTPGMKQGAKVKVKVTRRQTFLGG